MHMLFTIVHRVKRQLSKRPQIDFQDQLSFNAGQKYCRMHYAILSTFIKETKSATMNIFQKILFSF